MAQSFPISIIVTGLNLALAVLVLSRKHSHWVNRSFALFALAVAGWTASTALGHHLAGTHVGLFWARLAFLMAGSSVFAMLLFFHVFPFQATFPHSRDISIFAASASAMAILSLSPWVVAGVTRTPDGLSVTYGPLYPLFAAHVLACVIYSLATILRKSRSTRGAARQQLDYLFVALLVPGLFATVTNLIIPLTTGRSQFGQYGPLFSCVMIAMIAHAIIRHRLMNVRLVIRRGSVYLIAAAIAGAVFAVVIAVISQALGQRPQNGTLPLQVAVALAIALAFQPLKGQLQTWLDRYVYRETYNYQHTIRDASRTISATLDLRALLQYLCDITSRTFHPDFVAVFTREASSNTFRLAVKKTLVGLDESLSNTQLPATDPLPTFLVTSRRPILKDGISQTSRGSDAESAGHQLSSLGAEVVVPILSESHLIGFLLAGPKLSGDAYFTDDIELLATLAGQAAIAVNNAKLYGQVVLANQYIENILRTMDSGVITVDASGQVAVANTTAEHLTELSRSTLTSLTIDALPDPIASQLKATLRDGQPRLQVETTLRGDSNRLLPIVSSTSALRDEHGAIHGALIVFSDLSNIKALESEKRRAERLAAFGTLVSGIAHEIKNPLVAIRTFAELLPERFTDAEFREDFSKVVINEIDRIDDLVARLRGLAVPSPQAGGPIDIRESIIDTLVLLRGQLEQARITVHRELEDPVPHVAIDAAQVKQLFLNLFINAIEAMGSGGALTVRVGHRITPSGNWLVAEVSDTGPGIPEAIRTHIFDPFFTTKPRGSGLGLAICRGITDAHRGTLRAESNRSGTGTTIVVEFPVSTATPNVIEEQALLS
ncbi:MAG: PAS domain-containing protein [Candidatus Rokubacteria bacterium]|nr:PAS domain-containing protein [Candidatus Rokubacteria bacterium]